MFLKDLAARLRVLPESLPVEASVPGWPDDKTKLFPVTRVAQHDRSEDNLHDTQPVELFADDEGAPLTVGEVVQALDRYNPDVFVRVGIELPREGPDDPGNVRVLEIEVMGLGGDDGVSMTAQLRTEPWASQAFIIRRNAG